MRLIGLYFGTKYEVCGSNMFWDMNLGAPDFLLPWNSNFDLESRSSKNISLNVNQVVLPSYQVWSGSVKWFRIYLKLKFYRLKFCPPDTGRLFVNWSPGSNTHKRHKNFLVLFFFEREMYENIDSQNLFCDSSEVVFKNSINEDVMFLSLTHILIIKLWRQQYKIKAVEKRIRQI